MSTEKNPLLAQLHEMKSTGLCKQLTPPTQNDLVSDLRAALSAAGEELDGLYTPGDGTHIEAAAKCIRDALAISNIEIKTTKVMPAATQYTGPDLPQFSLPLELCEVTNGQGEVIYGLGMPINDMIISDPFLDESGRFPVDPEKEYGLDHGEAAQLVHLNRAIEAAADAALNAACLSLQEAYSIPSGDVAAHHFSGDVAEDFKRHVAQAMAQYMTLEINMNRPDAPGAKAGKTLGM